MKLVATDLAGGHGMSPGMNLEANKPSNGET
jgi:hypothetical protein